MDIKAISVEERQAMPVEQRIKLWQQERLLDQQGFDADVVTLNILEEIVEMNYNIKSDEARGIAAHLLDELNILAGNIQAEETSMHQKVDALCDIKIFSSGGLLQAGYDNEIAMQETLKEIESRQGTIIDGKFVKHKTREAVKQWVEADYNKAKLS